MAYVYTKLFGIISIEKQLTSYDNHAIQIKLLNLDMLRAKI